MTRVTDSQVRRVLINDIIRNKEEVAKYSDQVATGIKVNTPSDSDQAATIQSYQETLRRVESYQARVNSVQSYLRFQENVINSVNSVLIRAKELGSQGSNGSTSVEARLTMSKEVFELRDHLIALANSTYQGKYVYGGAVDNTPPYTASAGTNYTVPATTPETSRYLFTTATGSTVTRSVNLTDNLAITVNTPGNEVFDNAIYSLESIGRALAGYSTNLMPTGGIPDGTGSAYTFPTDFALQTQAINDAMVSLDSAISNDINPELASVAARERRLETAQSILKNLQDDGDTVIGNLQKADASEAASSFALAQTALQASYTVSSRVLNMSILDYI